MAQLRVFGAILVVLAGCTGDASGGDPFALSAACEAERADFAESFDGAEPEAWTCYCGYGLDGADYTFAVSEPCDPRAQGMDSALTYATRACKEKANPYCRCQSDACTKSSRCACAEDLSFPVRFGP